MSSVLEKLKLITDIWNEVFLSYSFVQNKVSFNNEKATNYYGEITHYFRDTYPIVEQHESRKHKPCKFHEYIFYSVGILQTLYVQQDLLDEMLMIFALDKSSNEDKQRIRDLRNELVGHPISRDLQNKLTSSVFWLGNPPFSKEKALDHSKIQYRKI